MAECPQCRSSIEIPEQNFGTLFTCSLCQAVYFVGWDGNPEQPQNQAPPEIPFPPENPPSIDSEPFQDFSPTAVHVDAVPDFKDIVEFGNSPQLEGSLTYTIFIKGIELADTREKIKEAMTDSKFAWDAERLISQITHGALTLPDLSPAKAVVLINRIKYLPIEVSWNQNVLT